MGRVGWWQRHCGPVYILGIGQVGLAPLATHTGCDLVVRVLRRMVVILAIG